MTPKQKALKKIEQLGLTWQFAPSLDMEKPNRQFIEVFAPVGKQLESGTTSYISYSWQDVIDRLKSVKLLLSREGVLE